MRLSRFILFAFVGSAVLRTGAVSENTAVPDFVVQARVERERDQTAVAIQRERDDDARQKAFERVEKIRNLPIEQIPAWIASDRSDATLERLLSVPVNRPADAAIVPRSNVIKLVAYIFAAVILLAFYMRRRRMGMRNPADDDKRSVER